MLGFLNAIDFSGMFGLSSDISSADLFSRFRSALTPYDPNALLDKGVSDSQINSVISYVMSKYDIIRNANVDAGTAQAVTDDVTNVVQQNIPTIYWLKVQGVVAGLQGQGYALVPKSGAQTPAQNTQNPSAPSSGGGFWNQIATAPTAVAAAIAARPAASGGVRVIKRVMPMSVASKNRLYWMLGVGGLVFVVAIVAIAARD